MTRWKILAGLLLALTGCDRVGSTSWKEKFVKEVDYHYQTQQIKNAEIAARDMEIENQNVLIQTLNDRIAEQEKSLDHLRDKLFQRRGPLPPVSATVTAVAGEIGLVVLDAGSDRGLYEGDQFSIVRDNKPIARIKLDRVDKTWSAGKVVDRVDDPRKGDTAVCPPIERPK